MQTILKKEIGSICPVAIERSFTFIDSSSGEERESGHDVQVSGVVAEVAEQLVAAQPAGELAAPVARH